jgi:hypothetical protein
VRERERKERNIRTDGKEEECTNFSTDSQVKTEQDTLQQKAAGSRSGPESHPDLASSSRNAFEKKRQREREKEQARAEIRNSSVYKKTNTRLRVASDVCASFFAIKSLLHAALRVFKIY